MKLDLTDRKILAKLDRDSRASASSIAKGINARKETVNYRIRRLERQGILLQSYAILNLASLGYQYIRVYLKFQNNPPQADEQMLQYLQEIPSCTQTAIHEGSYDLSFVLLTKTSTESHAILAAFRKRFGRYINEIQILTLLERTRHFQHHLYGAWHDALRVSIESSRKRDLDEMDQKILNRIDYDARVPLVTLGHELGQEARTIAYRIKRLEQEGVIVAYTIWPDYTKLGLQQFEIAVSLKNLDRLTEIETFFGTMPSCLSTERLFGRYDLAIQLLSTDNDAFKTVLRKFRERYAEDCATLDILQTRERIPTGWSPFQ